MELKTVPNTALHVSPIVLGAGAFGSTVSEAESFRILDTYCEAGGNFVDTANNYASWLNEGEGKSETTIGKWMLQNGMRDEIVLATKGAHAELESGKSRMTHKDLNTDINQSLDRLQVDSVDLYWLHRDDPDVPVGEIMGWLDELRSLGMVNAIGCSNWSKERIDAANRYEWEQGRSGFCASQIGWSLAETDPLGPGGMCFMEPETWKWHERTGFPLLAYSSQASGFFSEKYKRGIAPENRESGVRPWVINRYGSDSNYDRKDRASQFGEDRGVPANQIALAWLIHQSFPVFPIIGSGTVEQLSASLGAISIDLVPDDINYLWMGN